MNASRISTAILSTITLLFGGCSLLDDNGSKRPAHSGLIATPVTYYSTSRARYLGAKYKDNLDRLVERIVRNGKTANLQFANNIASVGGIGFFTHSATKTADERFLEVVLAAPETFETKGDHSAKVNQLFNSYGTELLTILTGDNDIYQDKELTGYGLNLSWRTVVADATGNRVTLERAIVYLAKERSRSFLRREINQNQLLGDATIFAVEEDGPLTLLSYRAPAVRQDYRPGIREDDIAPAVGSAKPAPSVPSLKPGAAEPAKKEATPPVEPVAKVTPPKPVVPAAPKPKPAPAIVSVPTEPVKPSLPSPSHAAPREMPERKSAPQVVSQPATPPAQLTPTPKVEEVPSVAIPAAKIPEPETIVAEVAQPIGAPKIAPPVKAAPPGPSASTPVVKKLPESPTVRPEPTAPPRTTDDVPTRTPVAPLVTSPVAPITKQPESSVSSSPIIASAVKPGDKIEVPAVVKKPVPVEEKTAIAAPVPSAPAVTGAAPATIETAPGSPATIPSRGVVEPPAIVRAPPVEVRAAREPEPAAPSPEPVPPVTPNQPVVVEKAPPPLLPAPPPVIEKTPPKSVVEQLASLPPKPAENIVAKPSVARPSAPKPLEGFIIQLAFRDKERAQRWAEGMEKKGFAVSVTESGAEGALRVRVGNFAQRDDAERQLKNLKQEGLVGIILNLPQAFRPEARTSIP